MVQVINMPATREKRTMAESFGQGLERGIPQGLQTMLQDMLQEKESAKQQSKITQLASQLSPNDTDQASLYAAIGTTVGPEQMLKFHSEASPIEKAALMKDMEDHSRSQESDRGMKRGDQGIKKTEKTQQQELPTSYKDQERQEMQGQAPGITQGVPPGLQPKAPGAVVGPAGNPLLMPGSQYQMTQPEQVKGPSEAFPKAGPVSARQAAEPSPAPAAQEDDGYHTVAVGRKSNGEFVYRRLPLSLNDAQTDQDARDFMKYAVSPTKQAQQQAQRDWMAIKKDRRQASKEERGARTEEVSRAEKFSDPYLKGIEEKRETTRKQSSAIELAKDAIESSGDSSHIGQYFADKFGFDPLVSSNSALLKTASKEFILGNLRQAGSRPNMWIEQQIGSMFPSVGRSKEANLSVVEALKYENDINKKEVEIADKLSDKYIEELGYVPRDISKQVNKELAPYIDRRKEQLGTALQEVQERKLSQEDLDKMNKVRKGTPLTKEKGLAILKRSNNDVKKAEKLAIGLGYKIPEFGE